MPDRPVDMAACLKRVAAGDHEAARALVEHCHPLVAKLVRAHLPRQLSEDDLTQEVFLVMFARFDRYTIREGIPFEHWLARLTVNVCRDALRRESRQVRRADLSHAAADWLETLATDRAPPVEDAVAARELVDLLLAALPAEDRLILTMLDLEERSVAEVAQLTGRTRTSVKVRAFRARRRLRAHAERLARDGAGPQS